LKKEKEGSLPGAVLEDEADEEKIEACKEVVV
jgi:hypothetical protein